MHQPFSPQPEPPPPGGPPAPPDRDLYRLLVRNFPHGAILLFDRDLRYAVAEGQALGDVGPSREQLEGRTPREVLPAHTCDLIEPHYRAALEGRPSTVEVPYAGRVYLIHVNPVRDGAGHVFGGMVVTQDITARKQTEEALWQSERKYRDLVETSNDLIWSVDTDGRWTFVNRRAALRIYGYEPGEMLGRPFMEFETPEQAAKDLPVFDRIKSGEEFFQYETVHVRKDGRPVHLLFNAIVLRDHAGHVRGTTGTATDVTESRRAEVELRRANAALRESEERFRRIAETVSGVFWMSNPWERRLLYVSPAYEKIWGRPPEELYRDWGSWIDAIHPDDRERVRAGVPRAPHEAWGTEYRVVRPDGSVVWVHDRAFPVAPGSEDRRVVGFTEDITDRKRAEEELRAAHDSLEQRVAKRTAALGEQAEALAQQAEALADANRLLAAEVARRRLTEEALRKSRAHFKELAESNRRLLREVDHRVGNNLAALLSLLALTRGRTTDVEAFAAAVEGRLMAMARIHQLLSDGGWAAPDLRVLVGSVLGAMAAAAGGRPVRVEADGPPAAVAPRHAVPVAMILFEWFTDSAEHGAHRTPDGRVGLTWEVLPADDNDPPAVADPPDADRQSATTDPADDPAAASTEGMNGANPIGPPPPPPPRPLIRLRWCESGGPPAREPAAPSVGTELVQAFVARELRGRCEMRYPPAGADHWIEFRSG